MIAERRSLPRRCILPPLGCGVFTTVYALPTTLQCPPAPPHASLPHPFVGLGTMPTTPTLGPSAPALPPPPSAWVIGLGRRPRYAAARPPFVGHAATCRTTLPPSPPSLAASRPPSPPSHPSPSPAARQRLGNRVALPASTLCAPPPTPALRGDMRAPPHLSLPALCLRHAKRRTPPTLFVLEVSGGAEVWTLIMFSSSLLGHKLLLLLLLLLWWLCVVAVVVVVVIVVVVVVGVVGVFVELRLCRWYAS